MNSLRSLVLITLSGCISSSQAFAATSPANQDWQIDQGKSQICFSLKNMGLPVKGKFKVVAGKVVYDGNKISEAVVHATIDPASIDTGIGLRDHHLKGKDFFNISKFSEIEFQSTKIVPAAGGSFDILGSLKMHGVAEEVTLKAAPLTKPVVDKDGKTHISTQATASLNRKDFSIGGIAASSASNSVDIQLKIDLRKD